MFSLDLLGTVLLSRDGTGIRLPRKKATALLAYVAVEAPVSRESLAALLWPDSDQSRASGSHRGVLHSITRALGKGALRIEGDLVTLGDREPWEIDLRLFDDVHRRIAPPGEVSEPELERAIALYRGAFMTGFTLPGCGPFDDWQDYQRGCYRTRYRQLLNAAIEIYSERELFDEALAHGERLISLDGLDEESHRTVMRLYARAGRKREALEQFARCKEFLGRELGSVPSIETVELQRAIRTETFDRDRMPRSTSPIRRPGDIFVGRKEELESLRQLLSHAILGTGRVEMISGEPGIGKTRLARELAELATDLGVTVLRGAGYGGKGTPPLWLWVQILTEYIEATDSVQAESEMGAGIGYLGRILPGRDAPAPPADADRFRLFAAVWGFLKRASEKKPMLLILDDLQWADSVSLSLFAFMAREIDRSRIFLLGILRDTDFDFDHPARVLLDELVRIPGYRSHHLTGLSPDEVGCFLASSKSEAAGRGYLRDEIHSLTGGNPLFVEHIVPFLAESSILAAGTGGNRRLPAELREAIGIHIRELSSGTVHAVRTAALLGLEFSVDVLVSVTGERPDGAILRALDEAMRHHVVEETERRNTLRFAHELVRDALIVEIPYEERIRLHARIGNGLEELYEANIGPHAAEILYHYTEASSVVEARRRAALAFAAGKHATSAYSYQDARSFYDLGLEALGDAETDDLKARLLYYRALAPADGDNIFIALTDEAARDIEEALRYFAEHPVDEIIEAIMSPSNFGHHSKGVDLYENLLRMVRPGTEKWRGHIIARLAEHQVINPPFYDEGKKRMEEASAIAEKTDDACLMIEINNFLGTAERWQGRFEKALSYARASLEYLDNCSDPRVEYTVRHNEIDALERLGRFAESERRTGELLEFARSSGDYRCAKRALMHGAYSELEKGNLTGVRSYMEGVDAASSVIVKHESGSMHMVLAYNEADFETGNRYLREITTGRPFFGTEVFRITIAYRTAWIHWEEDLLSPIVVAARQMAPNGDLPRLVRMVAAALSALAAIHRDERENANQFYETLDLDALIHGHLVAGIIALGIDRFDEALDHLDRCCADPVYRRYEYIWGRCHRGETLLRRRKPGDREEAIADLEEAIALARQCGMKAVEIKAVSLLEVAGGA